MPDQNTKAIVQRPVDPHWLSNLSSQHPLLAQIYAARHVGSDEDLDLSLSGLASYKKLKGIDSAVNLLHEAMLNQQRILVVGDFDADGATSCALSVRCLRAMGAESVDYLVPNRFEYGYGLTPEIVEVAKTRNPDLIITVDNGISSIEGVALARQSGIKVLITDHHLPGEHLPKADAIINPSQPGCEFPSKSTAGVGVVFYLCIALRAHLRAVGWFEEQALTEPNLADFLDIVALGTVADLVPLDRNNRILVYQGLQRIRSGRTLPGIAAILEVSGRNECDLVASDLGFALGPRLNAAGRLDDMSLGIECLLTDDQSLAMNMAFELDSLNQSRKEIEADMKQSALHNLSKISVDANQVGLCLYDKDWHQGVIGILASRVKDRYHRPVVAFADAGNGVIKGSARSIKGFHMRDALDAVAKRNPELLQKFGGHAMAAGLSIEEVHFAAFAEAFNSLAMEWLNEDELEEKILTDGVLKQQYFTMEIAHMLRNAGPWGQHFPEPQFEGVFDVLQQRIVGDKHLKLSLSADHQAAPVSAIAFFVDLEQWPNAANRVRLVYRMDINEFRGNTSLQLIVEYLEPVY